MRELSEKFMIDLIYSEGLLFPILDCVRTDQTLMLTIRDGFINIYYRGGNILRVSEIKKGGAYRCFFDNRYNKTKRELPYTPVVIKDQDGANKWVLALPILKSIMDQFFSTYSKDEREFQQLVARENNSSSISNESDYFISDIEVSEPSLHARFDLVAIKWPSTKRRSGDGCRLAFIEMKYSYAALGGKAGLLKHLQDMDSLISNDEKFLNMKTVIEKQFHQLDQLGLLKFNKGQNFSKVSIDPEAKPEVIFILANHNPRAKALKKILNSSEINVFNDSKLFDLKFFVANYSGYGLYKECMRSLNEFIKLL